MGRLPDRPAPHVSIAGYEVESGLRCHSLAFPEWLVESEKDVDRLEASTLDVVLDSRCC